MRKIMTAFVAVGVLVLGACGGDDDDTADNDDKTDETDDNDTTTSSIVATGPAADTPFCQQAVGLFGGTETSAALDAAKDIEPPEELASDWQNWIDGIEKIEDSGAPVDTSDPEVAAENERIFRSAEKVLAYIGTECGVADFAPSATDTTVGGD